MLDRRTKLLLVDQTSFVSLMPKVGERTPYIDHWYLEQRLRHLDEMQPSLDDEEAAGDREVARLKAGPQGDPFKLKDPASKPLPAVRRPEDSSARAQSKQPLANFSKGVAQDLSGGQPGPSQQVDQMLKNRQGSSIDIKDTGEAGPPERTPLKTAPPKDGGVMGGSMVGPGAASDFANDLVRGGEPKSAAGRALGWGKDSTLLSRAQDTLDVVGIVDPTGVADATNALGYLAQGKFGDAAISAAGIIPFIGDVGKLGKWGARGAKSVKGAKAAGKEARLAGKGATLGGKAAAKTSRFTKAKEFFGRAKKAHGKIQARKATRDQGAAPPSPDQQQPEGAPEGPAGGGIRDRLKAFRQSVGTAAKSVKGRFTRGSKADTTSDLGRRPTGALSAGPTTPSLPPPDPGPLAKEREAKQGLTPNQRKLPGDDKPQDTPTSSPTPPPQAAPEDQGGDQGAPEGAAASEPSEPPQAAPAGRSGGSIKQVTVGANEKCPSPNTKSSFWGTTGKRCHPQTTPRDH